jgi:hypothetical protein
MLPVQDIRRPTTKKQVFQAPEDGAYPSLLVDQKEKNRGVLKYPMKTAVKINIEVRA